MKRCVIVSSWLVVFRSCSHSSSKNNHEKTRQAACLSVFTQASQPFMEHQLEKSKKHGDQKDEEGEGGAGFERR